MELFARAEFAEDVIENKATCETWRARGLESHVVENKSVSLTARSSSKGTGPMTAALKMLQKRKAL